MLEYTYLHPAHEPRLGCRVLAYSSFGLPSLHSSPSNQICQREIDCTYKILPRAAGPRREGCASPGTTAVVGCQRRPFPRVSGCLSRDVIAVLASDKLSLKYLVFRYCILSYCVLLRSPSQGTRLPGAPPSLRKYRRVNGRSRAGHAPQYIERPRLFHNWLLERKS